MEPTAPERGAPRLIANVGPPNAEHPGLFSDRSFRQQQTPRSRFGEVIRPATSLKSMRRPFTGEFGSQVRRAIDSATTPDVTAVRLLRRVALNGAFSIYPDDVSPTVLRVLGFRFYFSRAKNVACMYTCTMPTARQSSGSNRPSNWPRATGSMPRASTRRQN